MAQKIPTQKRASVLIEETLERNADRISNRENYVEYLAKRPGTVKFGANGRCNLCEDRTEAAYPKDV